jgi:hypothetical protein
MCRMQGSERVETAWPYGLQGMVVSGRVGWARMVNLHVGSKPVGSKVGVDGVMVDGDTGLVLGVGPCVGRIGEMDGMEPLLNAVSAMGSEGVELMVLWSWRQGAHLTSWRRVRSSVCPRSH